MSWARIKDRLKTDPVYAERYYASQRIATDKYKKNNAEKVKARQSAFRRANPDRVKGYATKRKYGVTEQEFNDRLALQKGACEICKEPLVKPCIDHLHEKDGVVRGILCEQCNFGLGHFRDNPERLRAAALYIESEYWKGGA